MSRAGLFAEQSKFTSVVYTASVDETETTPEDTGSAIEGLHPWIAANVDVLVFNEGTLSVIGAGNAVGSLTANANGKVFSYISGDDLVSDSQEFNVKIDFFGTGDDWTEALLEDFIAAADYLSTIITGDVADFIGRRGQVIDDIRIKATLTDIDGPGGVLGQAGPTLIRTDSALPVLGIMEFDTADAEDFDAQGLWDEIVLHEMMHTLGLGTLWETLGLVETYVDDNGTRWRFDDTTDIRFTGANANEAFAAEFPDIFADSDGLGIFVETDGGPGTAGGHWDEEIFDAELMTGFINDSGNYVSDMTIASLEDLGYETVWESAIA